MKNSYKGITRFSRGALSGLDDELIKLRMSEGLTNADHSIKPRSIKSIIAKNLFTLFNLINMVLALAIIHAGAYKNVMFMGVVICNCVIGIVQEIKAKITIDKLKFIVSNTTTVVRNGKEQKVDIEDVVLDDIIKCSSGDQVPADCTVIEGFCEANEALLTGEADLISKKSGDTILSGSFISSGSCHARVEHVGKDNYTSKILRETKYIKSSSSEIMGFLKKLIKIISISIIPIGALLFLNQLKASDNDVNHAVVSASAALIGMIPEGLVLLTSTAFAVSVVKLSKYKILAQDIYCTEALARVDTICLDKTGTITDGKLRVEKLIPQGEYTLEYVQRQLSLFINSLPDFNRTSDAIRSKFKLSGNKLIPKQIFPFSSEKKWSGALFENKGFFAMGAPDVLMYNADTELTQIIEHLSKNHRVIAFGHSENPPAGKNSPPKIQVLGLVLLKDSLRKGIEKTLDYFFTQGVDVKIISGDNAVTVSNIAKSAGVKGSERYLDMKSIKTDEEIYKIAQDYTVFGRTTPQQKQVLVRALKNYGHTVAMVGDGVNDVLALKESDCSIAVAGGSEAAKIISDIILLDSKFSSLSTAVGEGRRVINNIQKTSILFLTKTIYSCILAASFLLLPCCYPFVPIQMTLISALTIGIPSFILTFEPNYSKPKKNFTENILKNSIPFSMLIVLDVLICAFFHLFGAVVFSKFSTICVFLTAMLEITLLHRISQPLTPLRKTLLVGVSVTFVTLAVLFIRFFMLYPLSIRNLIFILLTYLLNLSLLNQDHIKLKAGKYCNKSE